MRNKYLFSLREELSILATYLSPDYTHFENDSSMNLGLGSNLLNYITSAYGINPTQQTGVYLFLEDYDIIKWDSDTSRYILEDYVKEVLDLFSSRYADELILKTYELDQNTLKVEARKIFDKILNILCFTYDKYKNLLNYYKDTRGELLKAIEDSYVDYENYSGENDNEQNNSRENTSFSNNSKQSNGSQNNSRNNSSSGTSRVNDTPQNRDSGNYGNEDYASQIEFANSNDNENSSSSVANEENTQGVNADNEIGKVKTKGTNFYNRGLYHVASHDRDTLIERLKLIDEYYKNIYKEWLEEFSRLTWEVANYEE